MELDVVDQCRQLPAKSIARLIGCSLPVVVERIQAEFIEWVASETGPYRPTSWVKAWPQYVIQKKPQSLMPSGHSLDRFMMPSYEAQVVALYGDQADAFESLIADAARAQELLPEFELEHAQQAQV